MIVMQVYDYGMWSRLLYGFTRHPQIFAAKYS